MPAFAELLQQGAAHAWLFIPSAILLGALHGLEPGHSKTMMAAFIIAVRGSVPQAVLLGLAATVSHTLVVWTIALGGVYLWQGVAPETFEPYLQLASAAVILAMAAWMIWRTRQDRIAEAAHDHHHHDRSHHAHGDKSHHDRSHHDHCHDGNDDHVFELATEGYQDAHELAHADDIRRRFAGRQVSTWQIVLFGLTGGLIPCPAAITVLLLCLQLRELALGFTLVLSFSVGLALTLVAVGVVAALSVQHATKRIAWFGELARRAPYVSGALLVAVALYVGWHGWTGLAHLPAAAVSG
ncbi:high-affinity nickel-transporter [Ancylobacter novellus DSM 506]|uniref:Nickel/cobalt efflux system n=1 Tax=Ancylobacter novellus (strain ATCC 8093 / DSM 506 / JCM 20403 / CCM 1077 / IAM 12100 / NBRC 12443 / NCIMB 10456) TaxID=639283 RepID=D7A348_ANCN5|nr:nickel/cobalt efflux transporter [Ancylobacter novellus]ADH87766.1 high-affinity nickel-transporter [Ancylobacter novellus DSM 506]